MLSVVYVKSSVCFIVLLTVVMPSVLMFNVVMLRVIMLSVLAPVKRIDKKHMWRCEPNYLTCKMGGGQWCFFIINSLELIFA